MELDLQREYIMKFFCDKTEGLGYREVKASAVKELFIPSDLQEFLSKANPEVWKRLLKYFPSEKDLTEAIISELWVKLMSSSNVAIFFKDNKTFTFREEKLTLFQVSITARRDDTDFKQNIFSVVEEMGYTCYIPETKEKLYGFRPDLTFFVNGIYIGYAELKSNFNHQLARINGRGKVMGDYLQAVKAYAQIAERNDASQRLRKATLHVFEKAIHLVATDVFDTYVLRGVAQLTGEFRAGFYDGRLTFADCQDKLKRVFKPYPVSSEQLTPQQKFEEVMRALYDKKMIEREILYYNFMKYEYKMENGQKVYKDKSGTLISPRPKQKYGTDKILRRVSEYLEHEAEPDYFENQLRQQLIQAGATKEQVERTIQERRAYCNNKYVFSLLMQYAPGFGKSNIIGWTALLLKDLRHNGQWAYDKIIIVVDRLQLRDQMETMMRNMNIDKAMYVEAKDADGFVNALAPDAAERIVVVNIQKFYTVKEALERAETQLKGMRVAFLIDEIHRSNTDDVHEEMRSLFDDLQDVLDGQQRTGGRKNLVVGFTATPSKRVLARFGEFGGSLNTTQIWKPFDCYSMTEAIQDGYILDPTQHIIPIALKMHFYVEEQGQQREVTEDDADATFRKSAVYEDEERMKEVARQVVHYLLSSVYARINRTGKAMLAVSSIKMAIKYAMVIRRLMAEECRKEAFSRYKDAPIAVVYSDNQEYESCSSMNGNLSEEKVIADFCEKKNGLMIVVDKLQTGFDEKRLHTLFLDKEITGINAVQTISRVNRICKNKTDCQIVDFSFRNVNQRNIKSAFREYCDMAVAEMNPTLLLQETNALRKDLQKEYLYVTHFKDLQAYSKAGVYDHDFEFGLMDAFERWILDQQREDSSRDVLDGAARLYQMVCRYFHLLVLLKGVIDIPKEHKDKVFLDFWNHYNKMYCSLTKNKDLVLVLSDYDDEVGIIIKVDEEDAPPASPPSTTNPRKRRKRRGTGVQELVARLNLEQELTEQQIHLIAQEEVAFFDYLKRQGKLMAMIRGNSHERKEIEREFKKQMNMYIRLNNEKTEICRLLTGNAEFFFDRFLDAVDDSHGQTHHFNYAAWKEMRGYAQAAEASDDNP